MENRKNNVLKIAIFQSFILVLAANLFAINWDNDSKDELWSNPANWSGNVSPSLSTSVSVAIFPGPTINNGNSAYGLDARIGRSGGTILTMNAGTLNVGQWLMIGIDQSSKPGSFIMNGGTVNLGQSGSVHGHLWIGYKSLGTFVMSDGVINAPGKFGLGFAAGGAADVHLDGGTINAGDFSMTSACSIDISGCTLIIDGDKRSILNDYITNGWITAFDGEGVFNIDYNNTIAGKTVISVSIHPEMASNPSPSHLALSVSPDLVLSWTSGVGAVSHDIYFGTTNPPDFVTSQANSVFTPGQLELNTTYFWRIDEFDGSETVTGDVWTFTTASGLASAPNPANGAMNIPVDAVLNWSAGYGTVSHDVYLGTDIRDVRNASRLQGDLDGDTQVDINDLNIMAEYWLEDPAGSEPYAGVLSSRQIVDLLDLSAMCQYWTATPAPFFEGNTSNTFFNADDLLSNTTYFWRVDEVCGNERRTGDVWSFKTTVINSEYSLAGKIMCGYQGWFNTPTDGAGRGWVHWGNSGFTPDNCTVDMWPDMTEMGSDEKYLAPDFYDGTNHYVFSSYNRNTVLRHFQWMRDYGIDGAYLQRFATELTPGSTGFNHRNTVLSHVREAANLYGRKYVVMYDLSGLGAGGTSIVINDWKYLVDTMAITRDPLDTGYAYHEGKPVVAIWGIGFHDNREYTNEECRDLVQFLKNDPVYGGNTVMIGVNDDWRTNTDSFVQQTVQLADIISPWLVGRYGTAGEVNTWATQKGVQDRIWCTNNSKDYLPVAFPGFSWSNLKNNPSILNQIPRNGGQFLWDQVKADIATVGASMIYIAMFDEVDEGTAIFKVTNNPPVPGGVTMFVTYEGLPSDDYLWLAGQAGRTLRGEIPLTQTRPSR